MENRKSAKKAIRTQARWYSVSADVEDKKIIDAFNEHHLVRAFKDKHTGSIKTFWYKVDE